MAMIEHDMSAVESDPFVIQAHDGFGHIVRLGQYGIESFATKEYERITATNTKYPEIRLVQILRESEREP